MKKPKTTYLTKSYRFLKKSETDDLSELSAAEKRRYDEIITIQRYLSEGYTPTTIRGLLHTTYNRIRRYAKGDPYKMCQFHINNTPRTVNTPKYRAEIIALLEQNLPFNKIHKLIAGAGCNAKFTAFREYCHKLINELKLEYHSKKNSIGVYVKKNQRVNVHYVSKKDVFKFIWSGTEINDADKTYIFGKYPILEEIQYSINDFRDIYVKKDTQLLENFINKYSVCSIGGLKSFANGLKFDIQAVKNSVLSDLSNGFVEGINNKIKVIKRVMYGRAKLPLLRAKILLAH